ncbi:hypothetical protein K9B35_19395 [Sphingomonas sp. R647]|uniref:hypothetical protein n=1 Tax=Sphingomonas sp. R647 TaxID=2875233 RepID=UPI001CD3C703|nr:hypothetical protein [Sphingomonas sp. R647]MCA1200138.1 hypothetical protein [Sphingomonas sp. R647]
MRCRILDGTQSADLALEHEFADMLVVEAVATPPELLTRLLAQMTVYAKVTGSPIIVSASLDQIDLVAGYLWPWGAQLLCEPSHDDRRIAIETALASLTSRCLHDSGATRAAELEGLRRDVKRIARRVETLAGETAFFIDSREASGPERKERADEVRARIRARRLRDKFFDSRLFADPAWDILLDLYCAHLEYREVSVSSLCIAAATPPTTALRWIASMTDADLLLRRPDGNDKRRHIISLSESALQAIDRYFAAMAAGRAG